MRETIVDGSGRTAEDLPLFAPDEGALHLFRRAGAANRQGRCRARPEAAGHRLDAAARRVDVADQEQINGEVPGQERNEPLDRFGDVEVAAYLAPHVEEQGDVSFHAVRFP